MKNQLLILLFLTISGSTVAQNDPLQKERYEVIDALFTNVDIEKYGPVELDRNFFPFLGLRSIISDFKLVDNLMGNCGNFEKQEEYLYSDLLSPQEISEMQSQIDLFATYKRINPNLISDAIKVTKDPRNTKTAITLPLVFNDKAIVYRTNKNNQESLFVLVKAEGQWRVRCVKNLYMRFDD